jgi:hypothetical protein
MYLIAVSITDTAKEHIMLTTYFSDLGTLHLIQRTPAAPYLDGFAAALIGSTHAAQR